MSDDLTAVAYVSCGVWVAKCPRPWCLGADHCGPGPHTGRVGGLTLDAFRCLYCGLACRSVWPDNAEDIWRVLSQRPAVETRNWEPHEALEDLITENVLHGLVPPGLEDERALQIMNGRVSDPALLGPAPARLMIGG